MAPATASAETPAGSLDPSFGDGGIAQLGFSTASLNDAAAYSAGPNRGKIVVVGGGSRGPGTPSGIVLARFDSNGTLDQGFGTGGVVVSPNGVNAEAVQVALDSLGRIAVRTADSRIARFTADGTLDDGGGAPGAGFGGCGCGFAQPSGHPVTSIAVTPDDEIAYAASAAGASGQSLAFVGRLRDDGGARWERQISLNANPGVVDDQTNNNATGVTVDPGGDLVVGGWFGDPLSPRDGAVELHSDGSFNDSFGVGGGQSFDISGTAQFAQTTAVALDSEGRVLLAGSQNNSGGECSSWVTRVTAAGDLDASFAGSGTHRFGFDHVYEIAADAENRILGSGNVDCHEMYSVDLGVLRLTADGVPDEAFGLPDFGPGRGQVTQDKPVNNVGRGMAVTDDGVDIVGQVNQSPVVVRFLSEPMPDPPPSSGGGAGSVASELAASPGIDVQQVIAPKKWRKLVRPGVRVLAGCDSDCEVDVTVTVSQKIADAIGVPSTVVARGSGHSAAGAHGWVSATAPRKIRDELRNYGGHGRLHVSVTAANPS